jgi:MSHA biogenesis protein MshK
MGEEEDRTGRVRHIVALLAVALSCALAQGNARAQPMNDPMRPADAPTAGAATGSGAGGPVLQAVITSPQRKLALIDGTVVRLGEPVKGATLDGVSDSVAVLRKDGARDVLLMHPDIDKKPARRERR